jgi:phage terminase large subunit-like protein
MALLVRKPYDPFDFPALYEKARTAAESSNALEEWERYGYENPKKWEEDFRLGQQDLFWLCTQLLGLALLDTPDSFHRKLCTGFFIKKNPYNKARDWKDSVAKQDTGVKNRLLLYPRGTFKSSLTLADVIQWILCFPNIRVLYMTAEENLAVDFVRQIKSYFQVPCDKDKKTDKWVPNQKITQFQMLYWAHCVPANKKEDERQFLSPARTEQQVQPTVLAISLGMSTAGIHGDVGVHDDCVSNKNSGPKATPENRKTVADEIKSARPLIDLYGYRFYVGTNWNEADAYEVIQEAMPDLRVEKAAAWTVKPGSRKKKINELTEDDVDLLFPADGNGVPRLTFKALMDEYKVDSYIFSCQYLLNPQASKIVKFTEQMLRKQIISHDQFPQPGSYFIAQFWDFAKTANADSDRSCGMTAQIATAGHLAGRMFISEIVRGRFSKSELPFQLARMALRWRPVEKLGIEKSPGADFLENDILRAFAKVGYPDAPSIEWVTLDTQKDAKNVRAETSETLMIDNRVFFSDQIPKELMDEVIQEFVKFKPGSNRKDDSVDTLGHIARYLPKDITPPQTVQEEMTAAWDLLAQKQLHERQFMTSGDTENTYSTKFSYPTAPNPGWKTDGYDRKEIVVPPPTHWEGLPIYQNPDQMIYGT